MILSTIPQKVWHRGGDGSPPRPILAAVMGRLLAQEATKHTCQPGAVGPRVEPVPGHPIQYRGRRLREPQGFRTWRAQLQQSSENPHFQVPNWPCLFPIPVLGLQGKKAKRAWVLPPFHLSLYQLARPPRLPFRPRQAESGSPLGGGQGAYSPLGLASVHPRRPPLRAGGDDIIPP